MVEAWIVGLAAGYFLGSVPVGLWVGKYLVGVDVRAGGSGKIGATNAFRRLGLRWSVLVFAADVGKGILPIAIIRIAFDSPTGEVLAASAALIGHVYPIYAGFRGGRGAATGFGALAFLSPPAAGVALAVGVIILGVNRIMSLAVLLGVVVAAVALGMFVTHSSEPDAHLGFAVAAFVIVVFAHRDNIQRLRAGTERVLGRPEPSNPPSGSVPEPAGD